jgi:hypothetical protein
MPRIAISGRTAVNYSANLLLNSNDLSNASWSRTNVTWSANQVANPVNGAMTAGALIDNTTNGSHFVRQINVAAMVPLANTLVNATVICQSIFAKAVNRNFLALGGNNGSNVGYFNLATGLVTSQGAAAFMQAYGNGWYRCWIVYPLSSATPIFYVTNQDGSSVYAGSGNTALYLYAPMINRGRTPAAPTITTGSASTSGVPSKIFPINLITYSNDFSQWNRFNSTVTTNAVVDPLTGQTTAAILTDDINNDRHGLGNSFTTVLNQDGSLTQSVFAKAAANSAAPMVQFSTFTGGTVTFDLINGVVAGYTSDVKSATIRSVGAELGQTGWYQCVATFNSPTFTTAPFGVNATTGHGVTNYVGTGSPVLYLARAQLVQGEKAGDQLVTTTQPVGTGPTVISYPTGTMIGVPSVTSGRIAIV